MDNYNKRYRDFIEQRNLVERAQALDLQGGYPLPPDLQKEYEALDMLRYQGIAAAYKKCWKHRMGQVAHSPTIQWAK